MLNLGADIRMPVIGDAAADVILFDAVTCHHEFAKERN
jgi:hypothetical protein